MIRWHPFESPLSPENIKCSIIFPILLDPRTQNWYLMRTPWPGLALMILYLMAVFKWLPKYMSNRPAYDLRGAIAIYNIIQIIGCSYVVYQVRTSTTSKMIWAAYTAYGTGHRTMGQSALTVLIVIRWMVYLYLSKVKRENVLLLLFFHSQIHRSKIL